MPRVRPLLGIVAGLTMVVSFAAHSLLGWPALAAALTQAHAPADLIRGLAIGWHFAGASMLIFGAIVLYPFARPTHAGTMSPAPARLIATLYLVFGTGALTVSRDPFFLVFIVPGLLLAAASFGGRPTAGR
jgi:hypothetical protein